MDVFGESRIKSYDLDVLLTVARDSIFCAQLNFMKPIKFKNIFFLINDSIIWLNYNSYMK